MKNDIIDKSYLALELTKVYCQNATINSPSICTKIYKDILKDLLDVEELPHSTELEEENKRILGLYRDLKDNFDTMVENKTKTMIQAIKNALDDNKINMEPYVYNNIMDIIDLNSIKK